MTGSKKFSAADSFIGYVYQVEYALFRALDPDDPATDVMIEALDDVTAIGSGNELEMIQLKHHDQSKLKTLTDKGADIWKTVRVWSTLINDGKVEPRTTKFFLMTTAAASRGSSLTDYLAPAGQGSKRSIPDADNLMLDIAREMEAGPSEDAQKLAKPFLALPETQRKALVNGITIVTDVPVIEELRQKIVRRLSFSGATAETIDDFAESVAGWWYWALVQRIRSKKGETISKEMLQQKISELVVHYAVMKLPTYQDIGKPNETEVQELSHHLFVEQLAAIGHNRGMTQVSGAMTDYYKADGHIKRWMQDLKLEDIDLAAFEDELRGHWETNFGAIEAEAETLQDDPDAEKHHQRLGRSALQSTLQGSQAKLKNLSIDYLRRGVFHLMANKPTIGWHPGWMTKFKKDG